MALRCGAVPYYVALHPCAGGGVWAHAAGVNRATAKAARAARGKLMLSMLRKAGARGVSEFGQRSWTTRRKGLSAQESRGVIRGKATATQRKVVPPSLLGSSRTFTCSRRG